SGSLFLGFLLAYQGISFLNLNESETALYTVANAPILLLAILSFPLLDTLRVFVLRAKERRSPFSPDRNHIHHRLLDLGLTHKQATSLIFVGNVLIIEFAFLLGDLYINAQLFICVCLGSILYLSPFLKVFEKSLALGSVKNDTDIKRRILQEGRTNDDFEKPVQPIMNTKEQNDLDQEILPSMANYQPEPITSSNFHSNKNLLDEKKVLQNEIIIQKQGLINKRLSELKKLVKKE
ncbi:MAG: hypothetical protein WBM53_00815, partial [Maribacter sp.]